MMHGFHRIDSMQGHYNLINREEEREMIPYCKSHSISLTSEEVAYLEGPYVPHRLVGVMEQVQDSMLVQLP